MVFFSETKRTDYHVRFGLNLHIVGDDESVQRLLDSTDLDRRSQVREVIKHLRARKFLRSPFLDISHGSMLLSQPLRDQDLLVELWNRGHRKQAS